MQVIDFVLQAATEQVAGVLDFEPVAVDVLRTHGHTRMPVHFRVHLGNGEAAFPAAHQPTFPVHDFRIDDDDALVVGISQSGQSPDIVSVLEEGRRQNCLTLAIVNTPDSPLARAADLVLDIQAGEEKAVAATKTYTAELAAVAMLSAALDPSAARWDELAAVPAFAAQSLALDADVARLAQRYRYMRQCVTLGRGFNYATAFEWALKLKELTYTVAEPYSSADFQHGPIAMVEDGFPILAAAPTGQTLDSLRALLSKLREEHRAELVVLSDDASTLDLAQSPIPLPSGIPEWLTPIVGILPAQLFACHLTSAKGLDTERPRAISKVTETR